MVSLIFAFFLVLMVFTAAKGFDEKLEAAEATRTCCTCGCILTDGKCLSCGHRGCFLCPVYVPKPTYEELKNRIAQLEAQLSLLQWTAIEEGNLPSEELYVLLCYQGVTQNMTARLCEELGAFVWSDEEADPIPIDCVSHWMHLPAPPTDKEQK